MKLIVLHTPTKTYARLVLTEYPQQLRKNGSQMPKMKQKNANPMFNTIDTLFDAQKAADVHFRAQRKAYRYDVDLQISREINRLIHLGVSIPELQKAIGSKDYATFMYYRDLMFAPLLSPAPPLNTSQASSLAVNTAPTSPTSPTTLTNPEQAYPRLKDYLTVDKENRKITLTNAPYEAFSQRTHNRPDLYELDPTNEKTYSGWAEITKTFGIGARSEDNSVFISENKEGGQLTRSVIEGLFA